MNIFSQLAEKTAEFSNADCIAILLLCLLLLIMVGLALYLLILWIRIVLENYVEELVCERENREFAYFRKYDVPKIVSEELKKQAFNGSIEHYSPKLRERIEGKAVKQNDERRISL